MKRLLIDFSQMAYKAQQIQDQQTMQTDNNFMIYHILLQIQKLIKDFRPNEVILAVDCASWRKDFYPHYKSNRIKTDKDLNMFKVMNEMIEDLKNFFPYKVIKIFKAEADDIIATLSFNKKSDDIIFIVSSDFDFIQLKDDSVILYDPYKAELLGEEWPCKIKGDMFSCKDEYVGFHVLHGDPGDAIFNFYTGEEEIENLKLGKQNKQKSFGVKTYQKIFKEGLNDFINNLSDKEKLNVERNKKLVLLTKENIPKEIQDNIMQVYDNYIINENKEVIKNYLESKKIKSLLTDLSKFYPFIEEDEEDSYF